ncbi:MULTISPECIES: glucarate dehydratase family protein [Agrobacterium]|jgi:glucarate dehydratase|uniref:glucarate dehydratase n=2 Tax=Agrobacterium tumefaciens complex TaxID=1183400 RepID=A0AAW8M0U0_AGRTU|nr:MULTISPECIES: glucarate dehydratase family protein [Agrobacterium]MCP2137983.1 glucarate dehydratase [Rhizobium sp. SLBN-94]EPR23256.1 glucarate dehydratase [Agrobacterium radiobacter DSM 30147]KAB0459153.1 glucarate dehydratase [Agrobacterium tumefaciens]KWT75353.1 glucarate dehydratase [Agrobacterium radiobacter]MBB4320674.1 glucarate dehydratase [Agrobacterium radiobacter]
MRIAEIHLTPVAIPDRPLLNCKGVHQPHALRTIIEVVCDDGTVGLGESYGSIKALDGLRRAAPALIGLDPFRLHELKSRVMTALPGSGGINAKSAVADHKLTDVVASAFEVPCLDIQGKLLGRPVCDLLGGAVRTSVPFSAYLFFKFAGHISEDPDEWGEVLTPDQMVGEARRMVAKYGFQSLKLKGGVLHPDLEIETMLKLREAFPHHPLRIDPNGAWTVETAIYVARKLENILEYLEDPVLGMDQMAQVAAATSIPLATNMIVLEFDHIAAAFEKNAVKIVLSDHHYWGGLRASSHLAKICEVLGLGLSMHSNSHLGITLAAMVHAAAATPNLTFDCDTHYPWTATDVTEGTPFTFREGKLGLPANPGLGVSLDRKKVASLAALYEESRLKERDDTAYMKLFDPQYERLVPRW